MSFSSLPGRLVPDRNLCRRSRACEFEAICRCLEYAHRFRNKRTLAGISRIALRFPLATGRVPGERRPSAAQYPARSARKFPLRGELLFTPRLLCNNLLHLATICCIWQQFVADRNWIGNPPPFCWRRIVAPAQYLLARAYEPFDSPRKPC